ncbi:MAG: relaxase/mobilization nuclease domain-containing protein [Actinomycetota bacterium]|nr:relaxase/mobilization nuclease domain-containing protein [Actinomycetota bacterium]
MGHSEWADIAQEFAESMGFEEYPWVAVKHGADHIHVVVSRVSEDPAAKVWTGQNDRWAAQRARRGIEQAHGLREAPVVSTPETKRVADHQVTQKEWKRAEVTGQTPARVRLAARVHWAATNAAGFGRAEFEGQLVDLGVLYEANVASTGRMNGYRFALPRKDHADEAGELVWFKASELDKSLAWKPLSARLDTPRAPLPARPEPGRSVWGRKKHFDPYEEAAADRQWVQDIAAAGQTWQLVGEAEKSYRQQSAATAQWWGDRGAPKAARARAAAKAVIDQKVAAQVAWRAARPTAWSDLSPEAQRVRTMLGHSSMTNEGHNQVLVREDTIRSAERGDPAAFTTLVSWTGLDAGTELSQLVAAAREHSAARGQAYAQNRPTPRASRDMGARPYQPPTPGRDRGHGMGR